jgi:tether containing UBX domain for GLUT4
MAEISEYFKETEEVAAGSSSTATAAAPSTERPEAQPEAKSKADAEPVPSGPPPAYAEPMEDIQQSPATTQEATPQQPPSQSSSSQPPRITSYLAPSGPTLATTIRHNEEDYIPSIDHAKSHQARLEASGKNSRLLSDAELETQRKEREAKLSTVSSVSVRFRMPDQTQIQTNYSRDDTASSLFKTMGEVLRYPDQKYVLSYRDGGSGKNVVVKEGENRNLIQGLGWTGNTLVHVSWYPEGVSEKAKSDPSLKDE